jgi:drug/metabolite transporter (DMT)-like permease
VFRENFDRRIALGMVLIVAGDAAVSGWGAFAVAGACLCWAIDNADRKAHRRSRHHDRERGEPLVRPLAQRGRGDRAHAVSDARHLRGKLVLLRP